MNRWFVRILGIHTFYATATFYMPDTHAAGVAHACGARGALRLVGGHLNNVGVSLRERPATTQVMLEVSLRARWDATLVNIMQWGVLNIQKEIVTESAWFTLLVLQWGGVVKLSGKNPWMGSYTWANKPGNCRPAVLCERPSDGFNQSAYLWGRT